MKMFSGSVSWSEALVRGVVSCACIRHDSVKGRKIIIIIVVVVAVW